MFNEGQSYYEDQAKIKGGGRQPTPVIDELKRLLAEKSQKKQNAMPDAMSGSEMMQHALGMLEDWCVCYDGCELDYDIAQLENYVAELKRREAAETELKGRCKRVANNIRSYGTGGTELSYNTVTLARSDYDTWADELDPQQKENKR